MMRSSSSTGRVCKPDGLLREAGGLGHWLRVDIGIGEQD